jgi:thiol:disulfide interchange protein DsbD
MTFPLAPGRAVCAVMAAAALLAPAATTAQETRQTSRTGGGPHVRVELIASQATLGPEMWLGLRFDLDPDWHIYWLNPGDSGGPPEARWGLPPGLQVAAFEWPAPYRFEVGGMINYGYHGTVVLPVRVITASEALTPAGTVTAAVRWLACANVCISGRSDLELSFPLGPDERREAAGWKTAIDAARSRVPKPAPPAWKAEARAAGEAFVVDVVTGSREAQAVFFPLEVSEVDDSAPQEVIPRPDGVRLVLRQSRQLVGVPGVLTGVLSLSGGRAYVIEAPFRQDEGPGQESRSQNPEARSQKSEARSQNSSHRSPR